MPEKMSRRLKKKALSELFSFNKSEVNLLRETTKTHMRILKKDIEYTCRQVASKEPKIPKEVLSKQLKSLKLEIGKTKRLYVHLHRITQKIEQRERELEELEKKLEGVKPRNSSGALRF